MNKMESPLFSIILAFRNESRFLKACLDSFDKQSLPREKWEIVLVDGRSNDGSRGIASEYAEHHNNCRLVDNFDKIATAGWMKGLDFASGEYFHIANAHSITDENFLEAAANILLKQPDIHALGGRIYKYGDSMLSNSIAAATNQPLAMGGSYYRVGTKVKKVNVIGQGIYLRSLIDQVGPYNTNLGRSGDWEFNYRICSKGFNMLFSPALVVRVFTRANYKTIFVQQFRTGFWKVRIWSLHLRSLLPRHVVPALFVLWLLAIPLTLFYRPAAALVMSMPILVYLVAAMFSTLKASQDNTRWYFILAAFPVIHVGFGSGFIIGLFRWANYLYTAIIRRRKNVV